MSVQPAASQPLPPTLRGAIALTAIIDLVLGTLFLFGPELQLSLWPTPVGAVLSRFIGSIVLANGVGAWLISRPGATWEGARVLVAVAMIYGAVLFVFLLYHILLLGSREPFFLIYALVDAIFLIPIAVIFFRYERGRGG